MTAVATNRTLAVKVRDMIDRFIANVKAAFGDTQAKELIALRDKFDKALSSENKKAAMDGGVQYHISDKADAEIQAALDDIKYRNMVLLRDYTPQIMIDHGAENLPMKMTPRHVRQNIWTEAEAKSHGLSIKDTDNFHGLGKRRFMEVIDSLDAPQRVYRGAPNASNPERGRAYYLMVSSYKDTHGNTINVPIIASQQDGSTVLEFNIIKTNFGRENFESYIQHQLKTGELVRIKNRTPDTSSMGRLQLPAQSEGERSTDSYYAQNSEKVNITEQNSVATEGGVQYSLVGNKDGKDIFVSNFPPNTPKAIKQQRIVDLVRKIWSKHPISLNIIKDGEMRPITAQFDPAMGERTDLSKIAYGNRKGTGSEKRITLELADDLYYIAKKSTYNGSKEAGEDTDTAMMILEKKMADARISGDYEGIDDWARMIVEKGTEGGRRIQAFAKYTRTAPVKNRSCPEQPPRVLARDVDDLLRRDAALYLGDAVGDGPQHVRRADLPAVGRGREIRAVRFEQQVLERYLGDRRDLFF